MNRGRRGLPRGFWWGVVCLLLAATVPGGTAAAQQSAVLRFRGRGAAIARNAAVRGVGDSVALVSIRDLERSARRLRARLRTTQGRARLAAEFDLDFLIGGQVERTETRVVIYGRDGEVQSEGWARRPFGAEGRQDIAALTASLVEEAIAAAAPPPPPPPPPPPVATTLPELEEEPEEEEVAWSNPRLILRAGVGGRSRDAALTFPDAESRHYRTGGLYPELLIQAEAHPFADGGAQGIYLEGEVAFGVGLQSQERQLGSEQVQTIDTSAWRLRVAAGYLAGLAEDRVRLGATVGYAQDRFAFSENQTMPSVRHSQVRIGGVFSTQAVAELLEFRLDLGFRFLLDAGEISSFFGTHGSGYGFDAALGIRGNFTGGFHYALRFEYQQTMLDFAGPASETPADSFEDHGLGVNFGLGWAWR